jgi:hypothetical protein
METIADEIHSFHFLPGDDNPAISRHWGYTQIKEKLKPLLFLERRQSQQCRRIGYISGKRGLTSFCLFSGK